MLPETKLAEVKSSLIEGRKIGVTSSIISLLSLSLPVKLSFN